MMEPLQAAEPATQTKPPSRLHRAVHTAKRLAKKKSVIGLCSAMALTGVVTAVQTNKPTEPTRYVLAPVERGTLVVSVSGSGQVSDENSLEMKPSVSGAVTKVAVKAGDTVKAGDVLVQLDAGDAQKTVRDASRSVYDARLSLESAQLSLQKLTTTDPQTLLKAENTLHAAERALDDLRTPDADTIKQAEADLSIKEDTAKLSNDGVTPQVVRDALDDATIDTKTAALDFRDALMEADNILAVDNPAANTAFKSVLSVMNSALLPQAQTAYAQARDPVRSFKTSADALASSGVDESTIAAMAENGVRVADQLKTALDLTQDVLSNTIASASFSQSSLDSLRSKISSARSTVTSRRDALAAASNNIESARTSYASALLNVEKARTTLQDLKDGADASDIAAAEERVAEAQAALDALKAGPDTLDIASAKNSVAQRQSSLAAAASRLADAREALADYTIRAPFDAAVGDVSVNVGDQASGSTALMTLITKGRIAEMTVNEVDAIKIKTGQKATLTFDAIPDLTIAGTVSRVDAVGTVSQGVVNYGVAIAFDTQDDRIKPGMTVSASIVTQAKTDALLVPSAAIQTAPNGLATVQTLPNVSGDDATNPSGVTSDEPPQTLPVQIGASNDQQTEVTDGLNEGDPIIIRTIQPSTSGSAQPTSGGSSFPGLGGGNVRIQTGGFGGGFRSGR